MMLLPNSSKSLDTLPSISANKSSSYVPKSAVRLSANANALAVNSSSSVKTTAILSQPSSLAAASW